MPTGEAAVTARQDSRQIRKFCSSRRLFCLHMAALVFFAVGSGLVIFGVRRLHEYQLCQAKPCPETASYTRRFNPQTGDAIATTTERLMNGDNRCCGHGLYQGRALVSGGVVLVIFCVIMIIISVALTLQNKRMLKNAIEAPPPFEEEEEDTWSAA